MALAIVVILCLCFFVQFVLDPAIVLSSWLTAAVVCSMLCFFTCLCNMSSCQTAARAEFLSRILLTVPLLLGHCAFL